MNTTSHEVWPTTDLNASRGLFNRTQGGLTPQDVYGPRFVPFTVILSGCLLFNTMSLLAITRIRGRLTVHHTLLLNLASCDICSSVLLWMYNNSPIIFGRFAIKSIQDCLFIIMVLVAPFLLSLCASTLSLLTLASNQYIAICMPLFSTTRITKHKAFMCILLIWFISTTCSMIPVVVTLFKAREQKCGLFSQTLGVKAMEICAYVLAALVIVIIGLYGRIYKEIAEYRNRTPQPRRVSARVNNNCRRGSWTRIRRSGNDRTEDTERNYKAFITTLLLSGTLVLFWLPYLAFTLITAHADPNDVPDFVMYTKFYFVDFLPMINCLADPMVYGIRMREIRTGYRRLCAQVFPRCVDEPQYRTRESIRFSTLESSTV